MNYNVMQRQWLLVLAFLLFFAVPVSTTLKSIILPLILISILLDKNARKLLLKAIYSKWFAVMLVFVGFVFLECFRGPADLSEKMSIMLRYSKLLYLPLFAVLLYSKENRELAVRGFLFAMLITCILSFANYMGIHILHADKEDYLFRNHIMTGHMLAFAAYICLIYMSFGKKYYGILALVFYYQVFFISTSRTGPILALILILMWLIQYCKWSKALIIIAIMSLIGAISYNYNGVVHERVTRTWEEFSSYKNNHADTSVGYRLQFHSFAYDLWHSSPVIGIGTAGFTHEFAQKKPVPSWDRRLLEPHSQYWLILVEQGLVGLFLYSLMLLSFLIISLKVVNSKALTLGMLVIFTIGNFSDSLLLYSGSGYFFLMIMSLGLGEFL